VNALFPKFDYPSSVELTEISLVRGDNHLFENLSLRIEPGDIIYVQGQNGIGKTSLLRLVAGFARAESGTVNWLLDQKPCSASQIIAYQGHHDALKPRLKTMEELKFWAELNVFEGDLMQVLKVVDLENRENLQTAKLSAGQKRRLAMARLIISQKPIWILDEPAAAMDETGVKLIEHIVTSHIARGGSVMWASHAKAKSLAKNTRRIVLDHAA